MGSIGSTMTELIEARSPDSDVSLAQAPKAKDVFETLNTRIRYSICTLVTNFDEYEEMRRTFAQSGFKGDDCEYLFIDNASGNKADGYSGLNLFLNNARGHYIILCHQDVRVVHDDRAKLDAVIAEIDALDPNWGVLGNSGGIRPGRHAVRITDPFGDQHREKLPARVFSLDENFILVRRDANLALSRDLAGFHMYATDLCVVADFLGWHTYVVEFHLHHLSAGNKGTSFPAQRRDMIAQYHRKLSRRLIKTPTTIVYLSNSAWKNAVMNLHYVIRVLDIAGRLRKDTKAD